MEVTGQQKTEAIKQEYASRRRKQMILTAPIVPIFFAAAFLRKMPELASDIVPITIVGPVVLILVAGAFALTFRNWRCPACNSYLGKKMNPQFCSNCGVPFH